MKQLALNSYKTIVFRLFIILVLLLVAQCYPVSKMNDQIKPEEKDERRYPNGTVVGKYSYTDKEGNPIEVKYYADDCSYGVELKSIKMMSQSSQDQPFQSPNEDQKYVILNTATPVDLDSQFYNPSDIKTNISDPFEILNKDVKTSTYKSNKKNPDYELYVQNELRAPKKCGKDKVRVYFEKDDRKARSALDISKYCEKY